MIRKLLTKIIIVLFLNGILSNANATCTIKNNNFAAINIDSDSKISESIGGPNDSKIPAILKFNQNTKNALVLSPDASLGGTGSGTAIDVFKICTTATTAVFTFTNLSTTIPTNKNYTIKWGDGTPDWTSSTNWASTTHTYAVGLRTLTYIIEGTDGTITTKNYTVFLGSNPAIALGNPGNTDICIGDWLTFPITGTQNNDPGTTYTVTFNDGSPAQIFTHQNLPASITHQFNKKSCGTTSSDGSMTYPNSFSINIVATNLCTSSSVGVVPIYVSALPVAQFSGSTKACINTQVCFDNTSEGFQVSGGVCLEPKNVWSISPATGYTISGASALGNDYGSSDASVWALGTNDLCVNFTVAGTYSITIKSGSKCGLNDYTDTYTRTICIEPQLVAAFSTSTAQGCAPLAVTTTNTTVGVNQCPPAVYQWDVSYSSSNCGGGSGNYTYTNGTNSTSAEPKFNFIEPGTYTVTLNTSNSCGSSPVSKTIVVKGPPKVSIQSISDICRTSAITTINPSANINKCTSNASAMTYDWSFPGGTPATSSSEDPGAITYNTTGTFTVSLTVTNECGSKTANNKTFTIHPLPVISGVLSACVNSTSQLTVSIAGNASSWSSSPSGIVTIDNSGLVTGIAAGTTTITYTDVNGCSKSETFIVNPLPTATITADQTICKGAPAEITLTGANGVAPYTFTYNINFGPNLTPSTVSGNSVVLTVPTNVTGTFTYNLVRVSDASITNCINNQPGSATITINEIPTLTLLPIAPQRICIGTTINTFTATAVGGAGNQNFQWYENTNNSSTGGTLIPGATNDKYTPPAFLTAGTFYYYATVSLSASGCGTATSASAQVIVVPDPIIVTQPITPQTLCQGSPANALTIVADNGNSDPLNYQWYSNTFNSNLGGTLIPNEVYNTFSPSTNTIGTYYYYCVIKPIGLDCEIISDVSVVNVVSSPLITIQPEPSEICVGGTPTKLTVAYTNGTGTTFYQWFSNNINSNTGGTAINGANSANYNPPALVKGTVYYYCEITFSAGGCGNLVSDTAEVKINDGLNIASLNLTICSGDTFTIVPDNTNGDTVPVGTTYTWTYPTIAPSSTVTGASSHSSSQNNISQTLVNTSKNPAMVIYTVKPFGGICIGSDFTITVTVNPPIDVATVITNSSCNGIASGTIAATISGGTPISASNPYNILWTGPNGFTATTANISNLAAGIYNLSVDAGCTYTNNYTITEPTVLDLKTDAEKDITCFGNADGEIAITVSGGTKPYAYTWTKNNVSFANTEDLSNLAPGKYTVSVTDANLCGPRTDTFTITEPNALKVSLLDQTATLCYGSNGGFIKTSTVGGTPIQIAPDVFNYNYSWTGPNGFASNNQNLSQLSAGTYHLTVTDYSGCSDDLTVDISQTTELIIANTTKQITCYGANDASIAVTLSGGTAPYQFSWSNLTTGLTQNNLPPGDYTIKVIDDLGCQKELTINIADVPVFSINPVVKNVSCYGANDGSIALNFKGGSSGIDLIWSDGVTAGTTRNNLAPGSYTVTINSGSPCKLERTFIIIEPQDLAIAGTIKNPNSCNSFSGAIQLNISGGNLPYAYEWSNGMTSKDLSNVAAGNYLVKVTDANGCTEYSQFKLTNTAPIAVQTTVVNSTCNDINNGAITATITGGTPISSTQPYTISWTGPNGFTSTDANISNLAPGIYNLSVEAGCIYSNSYTITEPTALVLKTDGKKDIACFGEADGQVAITVSGGTKPYAYTWTKNNVPFANTEDLSNLAPGKYTITVTDANQCGQKTQTFTITEPNVLKVSLLNQTAALCYGNNDGAIKIITEGGTPIQAAPGVYNYNYSWIGPNGFVSNSQNLSQLSAGTYHLIVMDNSGCSDDLVVVISQKPELVIAATTTPITCYGSNNASIAVTLSGGTTPYQFSWSNLGKGLTQNNLSSGDYTINVTDGFGCQKESTINIANVPVFSVNPIVKNVSCNGAKDGSIVLNFTGGSSGVNLVWSDGVTAGATRNNLGPGSYTVTVNNGSPCKLERTFVIVEPQNLTITATIQNPNTCQNSFSGAILLNVSGGNPPYIFEWSNQATTKDLTKLVAGNYLVKITDGKGCTTQSQFALTNTSPLVLNVDTETIPDCATASANQNFSAETHGGAPPYTYKWSNIVGDKGNVSTMSTNKNGIITLQVTDVNGCIANYSYDVNLPEIGNPDFKNNSIGYTTYGVFSINDPIQFTNTATGNYLSVVWDFGDGTFSTETNPIHTYSLTKEYVVTQTVTYGYGCVYLNKVILDVQKGYLMVLPTAFTPNNDSVNDTYRPVTRALKNVRMDVYDTWGSLIYSEKGDSLRGWDGLIKGVNSENGNFFCTVTGETFYGENVKESNTFVLIK